MTDHFTFSVPFSNAGVNILRAAASTMATMLGGGSTPAAAPTAAPAAEGTDAAPARGKPGRKSNAEKAALAAAQAQQQPPTDDGLGIDDLGGDEGAGDELGLEEAAPPAKVLTLAGDVIPAFRDALTRVGGDKAKLAKVLESYGVKSVQLLPEAKFAECIAKLSKLK